MLELCGFLRFSRKRQDGCTPCLGENTYSLQPALKNTAPSLERRLTHSSNGGYY